MTASRLVLFFQPDAVVCMAGLLEEFEITIWTWGSKKTHRLNAVNAVNEIR